MQICSFKFKTPKKLLEAGQQKIPKLVIEILTGIANGCFIFIV
jgi:hypothetical protein